MVPASTEQQSWTTLKDEELLNVRFCDLKLSISGTFLEEPINQLYQELDAKQLSLHPPCYLGDEWFSPDTAAVIAIPFYLAHPRLIQLEQTMMMEVEGENKDECLKLLRHEAGHVFCHAYRLYRRKKWQDVFGSPHVDFNDFYYYQPYSKRYVHHLENWYAQSHPEEDFAETFAVWLNPDSNWQSRYQGWPAMKKLHYVDELMNTVKKQSPSLTTYDEPYSIKKMRKKLKTHYEQRKKLYADDDPAVFDRDLNHLFNSQLPAERSSKKASRFIRQHRRQLLAIIPHWTHERKFMVNRLIKKLIERCETLKLTVNKDESLLLAELSSYLTALTSTYLFTGKFKEHS